MTNPDELLRLAERVERESGADPLLAYEINKALNTPAPFASISHVSSLDAVEALRLRLLPGSVVFVEMGKPNCWCGIRIDDDDSNEAYAPTEARARLAALLRAVAGKEA